ncbi:WXG100 family type VII secretion target [Nocardiopsis alba]|uniref:WXG100 family type VII secretion target n=1 Tax=Nocardiopsis alba TaxID=53437 RepID=UPI003406DC7F
MSMGEVAGNPGKIEDLAATAKSYQGDLEDILAIVDKSVKNTLSEWFGGSKQQFEDNYSEFVTLKEAVGESFDEVIRETEEAANNWSITMASVQTRFQV